MALYVIIALYRGLYNEFLNKKCAEDTHILVCLSIQVVKKVIENHFLYPALDVSSKLIL